MKATYGETVLPCCGCVLSTGRTAAICAECKCHDAARFMRRVPEIESRHVVTPTP